MNLYAIVIQHPKEKSDDNPNPRPPWVEAEAREHTYFRTGRSAFEALKGLKLEREAESGARIFVFTLSEQAQEFTPEWKLLD